MIIKVHEEKKPVISAGCPLAIIAIICSLPLLIAIILTVMAHSIFNFFVSTFGVFIGPLISSALAFVSAVALYKLFKFIWIKRQSLIN